MNYEGAVQFSLPTAFDLECCIRQIGLARDVVAVNDAAAFVATVATLSVAPVRRLKRYGNSYFPRYTLGAGRLLSSFQEGPIRLPQACLCARLSPMKKLKLPEYIRVGNQTMKADEA